ncbi:phosphohydrolase [Candidatus Saganbacteria bacterium CG08_land_8_20_14_0_20_45_16]|uniref:bis(5'-nucleosyl)-tetraphosphatase (symmetrical) n=1 Tax=Candidatus Saganbacteria bacterium CG08_land_8_20_14_0_20_45_16 TaxID=2014293 RepID=A0A2H0Y3A8_UNCSA|nr:MAG: phosphohydrolase [Candidatus Saganbacteria bacterium CG08_land_8_20_14_0_20_45_16]
MQKKREVILKRLRQALGQERFKHSQRVEATVLSLAAKYQIPLAKASLAGLLHDYARQFDRPGFLRAAKKAKLTLDPISRQEPKLLHAPLGAIMVRQDFGIKDKAVLSAISRHTTGAPAMSQLEKIVYLADHIEEKRHFSGLADIRKLAFKDLDQAIVKLASNMIEFLLKKQLPVHPATVETRNYYLLRQ